MVSLVWVLALATGCSMGKAGVVDSVSPSTPAGLTAQAESSSSIQLTWSASTDNVGVTGYGVYRDGTQIADVVSTSFLDTGLTAGAVYHYSVDAHDAAGNRSPKSPPATASTPQAATSNVVVDFTRPGAATSSMSIGSCISTYADGATNIIQGNTTLWRQYLSDLGPMVWRIPLYYHSGQVGSSAGGIHGGNDGAQYISAIKAVGGTPMIAVGGTTNDNDIQASDAASLVHYFNDNGGQNGGPVDFFVIGNEPDNSFGLSNYIDGGSGSSGFHAIATAMRAATSRRISLAGPALASFGTDNEGSFQTFMSADNADTDIIDFHKYGAGQEYENINLTSQYSDAVSWLQGQVNSYFGARASATAIQIGEYNYNPFYNNWADAFFTSRNLVHTASVIGHVLQAGGRAYQYSDNNGPLGLITDGTGNNGQPSGQFVRLPVYWGVSAWTGGAWLRRFGANMVATSTSLPDFEVFATDNAKKVILINKSTSVDEHAVVQMNGTSNGVYSAWRYDRGMDPTAFSAGPQFQPPTQLVSGAAYSGGSVQVDVPWMSVVVLTVD